MASQKLPTIAIIGAGLSGLLLAQGLQKNGYHVTVYEKESYLGERVREWTMILHWAWPTLAKLLPEELLADLPTVYGDPSYPYDKNPETIPFYNATNGQLVLSVPSPTMRRVSRTRLRRLCARDIDIRWGTSLVDLQLPDDSESPATLTFKDGSTSRADLVIGADGPGSFVRKFLVGEEKARSSPTPMVIGNGLVKYKTAEAALRVRAPSPICVLGTLPGMACFSAVQEIADPNDPQTWTFHTALIWHEALDSSLIDDFLGGDEATALVHQKFAGIPLIDEPFRSFFAEIDPAHANFHVSRLHTWETVPWTQNGGRVTLAGDAAHALLPARGQGLNQALADVDSFVTEFMRIKDEGISAKQAVRKYEEELFERGPKAVRNSLADSIDLMEPARLGKGKLAREGFQGVMAGEGVSA